MLFKGKYFLLNNLNAIFVEKKKKTTIKIQFTIMNDTDSFKDYNKIRICADRIFEDGQ